MDKMDYCNRFYEGYKLFKERDQDKFEDIVNMLLQNNFYVYSPATLDDYNFMIKHFDVLEAYFDLMGVELINAQVDRVIYIKNNIAKKLRLSKLGTLIYLILYKTYLMKKPNLSLSAYSTVSISFSELCTELESINYFKSANIKPINVVDELRILKNYNIVSFSSTKDYQYIDIDINPTIKYVIDSNELIEIEKKITALTGGNNDEETLIEN